MQITVLRLSVFLLLYGPRSLHCLRNTIHCHLIVAFVLKNLLWLKLDSLLPMINESDDAESLQVNLNDSLSLFISLSHSFTLSHSLFPSLSYTHSLTLTVSVSLPYRPYIYFSLLLSHCLFRSFLLYIVVSLS